MSVKAVLNVASTATATNTTTVGITPTSVPASLIGSPTCVVFGLVTDLENFKARFNYLIYQTYNTENGVTGIAQASGTSEWISIPGVSRDFPDVNASVTPTSEISENKIVFTLARTISYTQTAPGIYTVTTE